MRKHNDLDDEYCLTLFSVFVIGSDIKAERQLIHIKLLQCGFHLMPFARSNEASSMGMVHFDSVVLPSI